MNIIPFGRYARAFFIFAHFAVVLFEFLSTTLNDLGRAGR